MQLISVMLSEGVDKTYTKKCNNLQPYAESFQRFGFAQLSFFSLQNKDPITMTVFELNWAWLKHYSSYGQWKIDSMITQAIHWIKLNNVWQTQLGRSAVEFEICV